jgi:hypothetical protein
MRVKSFDGYNFYSFDRFGDDLHEVLISYLLISDKIRFECVSRMNSRYNSFIIKALADNYCEKLTQISLYMNFDEFPANQMSEALIELSHFLNLKNFIYIYPVIICIIIALKLIAHY